MWQLRTQAAGRQLIAAGPLTAQGRALSFAEVAGLWLADAGFRAFWSEALRGIAFAGFCWECPALTAARAGADFECVFVESPQLARGAADPRPFAEHFRAGETVATFASLGGDAVLVAPCPAGPEVDAAHLAAFLATAGDDRASDLWRAVGAALAARLGERPVWLGTAGLGVAWLHVRLDSRPKYYRHAPYARLA